MGGPALDGETAWLMASLAGAMGVLQTGPDCALEDDILDFGTLTFRSLKGLVLFFSELALGASFSDLSTGCSWLREPSSYWGQGRHSDPGQT